MSKQVLKENGVIFPVRVFEAREAALISSRLYEHVARARMGNTPSLNVTPFDNPDHPLVSILMPVVKNRKFINALIPILGPDIVLRSVNVFAKPPTGVEGINVSGPTLRGSRYPIEWHWDDPRPGSEADDVVTAWIALTPSTVQSGCVRYVEGSHRSRIPRENPLDRSQLQLQHGEWSLLEGLPIRDAVLEPGEMAVHHSAVIHASAPNYSSEPRVGLAVRLYTPRSPHEVTGSRIGVLVSGQVVGADDPQQLQGLQLRDVVNMSWWKGEREDGKTMTRSRHFDHDTVHQNFISELTNRANEGDGLAAYIHGRLTLVGLMGVESNQSRAIEFFEQARTLGCNRAIQFFEDCGRRERSKALQGLREETKGLSSLAWLALLGDVEGMAFLLDADMSVDFRMRDGRQAVHVAAGRDNPAPIELLVERGANINSRTQSNDTPLHVAAASGHGNLVLRLLEMGAEPSLENDEGQTARDVASDCLAHHFED